MDDLLSEFLTETSESLSVLDVELVRLEQNPNDPSLLSNIFRLVHTIKGTCGFLGLPRLEAVAHASENVLGKFRDGELEVTPGAVTLILESIDAIKALISALEETEQEPPGNDADLIARLDRLAEGGEAEPSGDLAGGGAGEAAEAGAEADAPADAAPGALDGDPDLDPMLADMIADGIIPDPRGSASADAGAAAPATGQGEVVEFGAATGSAPASGGASSGGAPTGAPSAVEAPKAAAPAQAAGEVAEAKESQVANQSIRVSVELLESLMTTVSELVLTRNQLLQILRTQKDSEFAASLQRLNHVTSELQEGVMKTRMQPIGNAWAKLPRIIRDLSRDLGKRIELDMRGADTELDRQVLDLIKDPLTHMVRNSADHGIETPAERAGAGKPEQGTIRLNAYHEGGHIIIEIVDDGKGLSIDKIKAKALSAGLTSEAELAGLTEQQIQQFIFKPGFSTAAAVTSVSGRGVGMDVVKTNIERIGGTIELNSVAGRGSTFVIKIPLTLAIVSALIVECASERFAIPQISVVELVRAGGHSEHQVERINGTPVLRLRDRLLPLVGLRGLLKLGSDEAEALADSDDTAFIVVTQVGAYSFGIIVDRVFDTEEIVVKPVAPILRHIEMFSGNTILGDGSVIMILDPNGIASSTGEVAVTEGAQTAAEKRAASTDAERMSMLLFRAGSGAPKAVPLALVARLEDIDVGQLEVSNGQMVIQYRGRLMPVIPFDAAGDLGEAGQHKPVLVFADRDRSMGLLVDEIVDIVEEDLHVEMSADGHGLIGSAIIAGKATEIVDAGYWLTQAYKDWFRSDREAGEEQVRRERVLLVDDSPFFRNMLTPLLTVAGYAVTTVESADKALEMLQEGGESFDIIVSDIEMPGMNGFDFARAVKDSESLRATPIVALSSHTSGRDLDRGRQAGFSDYVAKFDRDAILTALSQTLAGTEAPGMRGAA